MHLNEVILTLVTSAFYTTGVDLVGDTARGPRPLFDNVYRREPPPNHNVSRFREPPEKTFREPRQMKFHEGSRFE